MITPQSQANPFDLEDANKAIGNALADLLKLMLPIPGTVPNPDAGQNLIKSITEAISAGSQACTEVTRLRAAFTNLRDSHRPRPHADPTAPGSLCSACSLHGAIVAWPCETWTAAERALTHGQA